MRKNRRISGWLKISHVEVVDDTFWIEAGIYTSDERLIDAELCEFIARAKTIAAENGLKTAVRPIQ